MEIQTYTNVSRGLPYNNENGADSQGLNTLIHRAIEAGTLRLTYIRGSPKGHTQYSDLGERMLMEEGSLYTVQVEYMTPPKAPKWGNPYTQ